MHFKVISSIIIALGAIKSVALSIGNAPESTRALDPGTDICPVSTTTSLPAAFWVWTTEVQISTQVAPLGSRAFRKDIAVPSGQLATSVAITISTDNEYLLFVQGQLVGVGTDWTQAGAFVVELPTPASSVVIAVNGTNVGLQAGLIAALEVTLECGSTFSVITDGSWKFNLNFPDGFQATNFDDSTWSNVFVAGPFETLPWANSVTVPPFP